MVVDAVSFVASALTIGSVRVGEPEVAPTEGSGLWRRAGEGLRFLMRHALLRVTLWASTTLNLFSFVASAVIVLFASRTLGLDPGQIGLAFGIGSAGGLLGAALAAPLSRRMGLGWAMVLGGVLFSAPLAFIPLATGPDAVKIAVLAATELVSALGVMIYDINVNSVKTAVTPDGMRSRAAGAFSTVNYGIRPLGAVLGGLLGEWVGVPLTLVLAGVGGTLAALWFWGSPLMRAHRVEELDVAVG